MGFYPQVYLSGINSDESRFEWDCDDHVPDIQPEMLVRRSADILGAELDKEVVLLSIERGSYYCFDSIGSDVWRRLEAEMTVAALSYALAQDDDADAATIAGDLAALLWKLRAEGIREVVPR